MRAARALLDRPLTSYYLIAGITTLLLCLGLVMVLSTASVADLSHGKSPYHDFEVQLIGIVVGVPIMWVVARCAAPAVPGAGVPAARGVGDRALPDRSSPVSACSRRTARPVDRRSGR